jgi:serine phosphatase RsbU (regulator of sigma subunit)
LTELVSGMNQYACSNSQSGLRFTTAFIAEYDPASRVLSYVNAGHNAPILRRKQGAIEHLQLGGLPLGILAEQNYQVGSVVLEASDWLVIYTDGLIEAVNPADVEYGEQRLLDVIHASAMGTPVEMLRRMMFDVDVFVGSTPQHDDITCMLLKITDEVG